MSALIEAGVLTVLGPRLGTRPEDGAWRAHPPDVSGPAVRVTTVDEARLPEPELRRTADDLPATGAAARTGWTATRQAGWTSHLAHITRWTVKVSRKHGGSLSAYRRRECTG